jgi:hypothetical protein
MPGSLYSPSKRKINLENKNRKLGNRNWEIGKLGNREIEK